uniref:Uncharacterized protein n=1 Tax=Cacopsylla melanoneura TaxID=428564 RepID=A0A8D9BQC1_9HEMI
MHSKLVKLLDARFNLFTAFVHFSYCKREGLTVLNTVMTGVTVPCQGPRAQLSSFQGSAVTDDFFFSLRKFHPARRKNAIRVTILRDVHITQNKSYLSFQRRQSGGPKHVRNFNVGW